MADPLAKPQRKMNFASLGFVTIEWLSPLMLLGARRPLESADLFAVCDRDAAASLASSLDAFWADFHIWAHSSSDSSDSKPDSNDSKPNPSDSKPKTPPPSLFRAVFGRYIPLIIAALLCQSASVACQLSVPTFIENIINLLLIKTKPVLAPYLKDKLILSDGVQLAFTLFGLQFCASIFGRTCDQIIRRLENNIRTILIGAVYEKSLRLSGKSSAEFTQGKILNLINIDAEKVALAIQGINGLYSTPIQIIVAVVLLYKLIGDAVWAGAGTLFAVLFLQGAIVGFLVKFQQQFLRAGDRRLKAIREVLYGIKVIKFRALEDFFHDRITRIRNEQVAALKLYYYIQVFFVGILQVTPVAMPIVAFITYSLIAGTIRPQEIFPALSLFNILFQPLLVLPSSFSNVVLAVVSWRRLSEFLLAGESDSFEILDSSKTVGVASDVAIGFRDASLSWEAAKGADEGASAATDTTKKGAVGDTTKPQRQNRGWGRDKNKPMSNTDAVVETTPGPSTDTKQKTQQFAIGTTSDGAPLDTASKPNSGIFELRDINLSIKKGSLVAIVGPVGSGKSSLLSAIIGEMRRTTGTIGIYGTIAYCAQQPWIVTETIQGNILFNNPLNQTVLDTVIDACSLRSDLTQFPAGLMTGIGEKGINLSGGQKARVALARALYQSADTFLLDDPISALDAHVGRHVFQHAIKRYLRDKTVVLVTHQLHVLPDVDYVVVVEKGRVVEQGRFEELVQVEGGVLAAMMRDYQVDKSVEEEGDGLDGNDGDAKTKGDLSKVALTPQAVDLLGDDTGKKEAIAAAASGGGIIVDEDRFMGAVKFNTYSSYIKASGGLPYGLTLVIAALLAQASRFFTDLWLTWWSEDKYKLTTANYLVVYGSLGASQVVFSLILNTAILAGGYNASKYFHSAALRRLMNAPMSYFDSQPIGRILNRLSKDVESIDQLVWLFLFLTMISTTGLISSVVLFCYFLPAMLALIIPLIIVYYFVLTYYQAGNRELKRLESIQRSPLYAHVSETLAGISTVRAFKVEHKFISRQRDLMDVSNSPSLLKLLANVWVNLRIELLASTIAFAITLLGTSGSIDASQIGLALTYSIGLTALINLFLLSFSQLDAELNAVERLDLYAALPQEAEKLLVTDPSDVAWPTLGAVSVRDLEVRYASRPDHAVLKSVSFDVQPGEKIGVVGRTGSGKSTLMTALFRIVEPTTGTVTIDGIDISKIGLKTLRSRLAILPQEPVLFSGTIRSNLDIESKCVDTDLWHVLDMIRLRDYVSNLPTKLDAPVTENGENLSVGQRQLICLGRAILMQPRLLVMDEATASVDADADHLIQRSIKTHFVSTTVMCIAHRLNTVMDFDRVMVLDGGCVVAFDSPFALLKDPMSVFSRMVDATGVANAQVLRDIAAEKEASKRG